MVYGCRNEMIATAAMWYAIGKVGAAEAGTDHDSDKIPVSTWIMTMGVDVVAYLVIGGVL